MSEGQRKISMAYFVGSDGSLHISEFNSDPPCEPNRQDIALILGSWVIEKDPVIRFNGVRIGDYKPTEEAK